MIRDFQSGRDRIDLSDSFLYVDGLGDLTLSQRSGSTFVSGGILDFKLDGYTGGLEAADFIFPADDYLYV